MGMSLGALLCAHRCEKRLQRGGGLGPPSQQLGAPVRVGVRARVRVRVRVRVRIRVRVRVRVRIRVRVIR